jgi:membrane-associated phospholipid phosphatase
LKNKRYPYLENNLLNCGAFLKKKQKINLLTLTMKNLIFALFLLINFTGSAIALPGTDSTSSTPYRTRFAVDAPIIAAGVGLSGLGLYLISDKASIKDDELAHISKFDVNKFDRFTAGNYDPDAKAFSDIPFYGSFVAPLLLLADKDVRSNKGQVFTLYLETMAITGTAFALTVGLTDRYRPLVYKNDDPNNEELNHDRHSKNSRNSFFAGHTAASASACFFTAKVFNDLNPDSKWKPVVWGAAAAVPALVGYNRLKAGKHFLSDNITGYLIGGSIGYLVPLLHKKDFLDGVSIVPVMGPYNGMLATVTF